MLSFIVPAYNEELELPSTIAAIKAAVGQDRQCEIIVVDDASTDATAEIAKNAGAKVISINRRQIAAARNAGARAPLAETFCFSSMPIRVSTPRTLSMQSRHSKPAARAAARASPLTASSHYGDASSSKFSASSTLRLILAPARFFSRRRANFDKVGGLDERLFVGEEVFFSLALKKLGRFKILREPVVTSGRKLRMYSAAKIFGRAFVIIFGGLRGWRSRTKLDLWHDGKRETSGQ